MKRRIAIVLCALPGTALIMLGGLSVGWWTQPATADSELTAAIGLIEMHVCNAGSCSAAPLSKLADPNGLWLRTGMAAYAATFIAGLLGFFVAVAGAAKPSWPTLGKAAVSAALGALVTGVGFLALAPDLSGLRTDASSWMYLTGAVLIGAAGVVAAPRERE